MSGASYELRVFSPDGTELARIPAAAFERLTYERRLSDVGRLTARFKDGDDARTRAIPRYAMIDVWRKPAGEQWAREDTYLLRRKVVSVGRDDVRAVTIGADHLNAILGGRVVAPGDETGVDVSGCADAVMKDLVDAWVGPGASTENQIADLSVDADKSVGLQVSVNPRRKNLLKLLRDIAEASNVDFHLTHTGGGALLFTADRPWGTDRTVDANKYTGGAFTLFALERGNMENPTLSWAEAELDRVHAAGRGRDEDREVLVVPGSSIYATRFNRRDDLVDARQSEEGDTDALLAAGKAALAGAGERRELRFDIPSGVGYGVTWDLGDLVSARFDNQTFDFKVEAVTITLDAGGEKITPRLGDDIIFLRPIQGDIEVLGDEVADLKAQTERAETADSMPEGVSTKAGRYDGQVRFLTDKGYPAYWKASPGEWRKFSDDTTA